MNRTTVQTYGFAVIALSIVVILIVPLPPLVLDSLLALNLVFAGVVLLLSITIHDPLEFAAFAPALLVATVFRVALDISAARLILSRGHEPGGVGSVIPAFGAFVVGDNLVVGLTVFAMLVTVQLIIIASGSQRVAEVAARFTLDAMPGKQMAIDADVHAGALDRDGAKAKRALVQKEADFYGAMDGAGKFVKGDAIAALVIVVVNILAGVVMGTVFHGLSAGDSLHTYALLSIGNALATTVPAFLMSISMGMMVTRVAADKSLGADLATQILRRPDVVRLGAFLAFAMALIPPMPHVLFAVLGIGLFLISRYAMREQKRTQVEERDAAALKARADSRRPEQALGLVGVDAIAIEFGADLAGLLAAENAEAILDRMSEVRRIMAGETGVVLPGIRVRDDQTRDPQTYAIRVRDEIAATGTLRPNELLAVARPDVLETIAGDQTRDPVYGLPAKWIRVSDREAAMARGAMVFDPISVVGSHLAEVARQRAAALFGRQELHTLVEHLKKSVPVVAKEVGSDLLPFATAHKAFTILLRERVWPRDPVAALEAMLEAAATTRDPRDLAEAARKVLIPPMLRRRSPKELSVLMLDPEFERSVQSSWEGADAPPDPQLALHVRERVDAYAKTVPPGRAVVVCTSGFRRTLSDLLARFGLAVDVFAFAEIPAEISVKPASVLGTPMLAESVGAA